MASEADKKRVKVLGSGAAADAGRAIMRRKDRLAEIMASKTTPDRTVKPTGSSN